MRLSLRQKFDTTLANELHSATDNDSQKYNTECRRKKVDRRAICEYNLRNLLLDNGFVFYCRM